MSIRISANDQRMWLFQWGLGGGQTLQSSQLNLPTFAGENPQPNLFISNILNHETQLVPFSFNFSTTRISSDVTYSLNSEGLFGSWSFRSLPSGDARVSDAQPWEVILSYSQLGYPSNLIGSDFRSVGPWLDSPNLIDIPVETFKPEK